MWRWLLSHSEEVKNIGQALAWLGAAVFFGWKVLTGYTIMNMSVSVSVQRFALDDDHDRLKVRLALSKGDRSTLTLKNVSLRVRNEENKEIAKASGRFERFSRTLRLTPGESTHFEQQFTVGSNVACFIDAEVEGRSVFRPGHWFASAVSVPEEREPKKEIKSSAERRQAPSPRPKADG